MADCFWTDFVGCSEDCGGAPPVGVLHPSLADYAGRIWPYAQWAANTGLALTDWPYEDSSSPADAAPVFSLVSATVYLIDKPSSHAWGGVPYDLWPAVNGEQTGVAQTLDFARSLQNGAYAPNTVWTAPQDFPGVVPTPYDVTAELAASSPTTTTGWSYNAATINPAYTNCIVIIVCSAGGADTWRAAHISGY